ncbi:MAG: ATP-binding protein, partial [Actinobacteria bacterium]|nr:ATP-binding protein [Actinomycetota bacterium]
AELLVVYGRRRVGKTALLRRFAQGKPGAYWVATISSAATLRRSFTQALEGENAAFAYDDWRSAFLAARGDPGTRRLLVIDEYPYLAGAAPGVGTVLQAVWDEVLEGSRLMVVLCGSHIGMMEREAVSYRAPLFGRRTGQVRLRPLPAWGVATMLPGYGAAAVIETLATLGGVPAYLRLLEQDRSIADNLERLALDPNGVLHQEPVFLLREELHEPRSYFALLQAIAAGNTRLNEIAQAAGVERAPASRYLATLIDLGVVERTVPVTELHPEKSRKGIYSIADGFLRFWFRFVAPHSSLLATGQTETVRARLDRDLAGFVAPWWTREAELDVVALGEEGVLLGECKWSTRPVGLDVLNSLRTRRELFRAATGTGPKEPARLALFSRSGFTRGLLAEAKAEGVLLVTADDVVASGPAEPALSRA